MCVHIYKMKHTTCIFKYISHCFTCLVMYVPNNILEYSISYKKTSRANFH